MKNKLFLFVVLIFPVFVVGQQDSLSKAKDLYHWRLVDGLIVKNDVDTTLNNIHKLSLTFYEGFIALGNLGSASYQFEGLNNQKWSVNTQNVFQSYEDRRIQNVFTSSPYTKLFYSNGTNEEQYLNVQHGQRITKNLWVTAELDKINSRGFYDNQSTDNTLGSVSTYYESKNKRFIQLTDYKFTRFSVLENGGIADKEEFREGIVNRNNLDVRLTEGSNLSRKHSIGSTTVYSLSSLDSNKVNNRGFLVNEFAISTEKGIYKDMNPDSLFYDQFGIVVNDSVYDELIYEELSNEMGWKNYQLASDSLPMLIDISLGYEGGIVNQNENKSYLNSGFGKVGFSYRGIKRIEASCQGRYYFIGYRAQNYLANAKIMATIDPDKGSYVSINGEVSKNIANYRYENLYNSNINWSNSLNEVISSNVNVVFENEQWRTKFEGGYKTITGAVYFDSTLTVQQHTGTSGIIYSKLKQGISLWKLNLDLSLLYQHVLGEDVFRLPRLHAYNSFYFESPLFNQAMLFRLGCDFYYSSSYYGNAYMPMLRSFYVQDQELVGNYPYFDFYVAAKVKSARVFVKISHINSGFSGNGYYAAPNYPMADRMLRLGVDWTFWN